MWSTLKVQQSTVNPPHSINSTETQSENGNGQSNSKIIIVLLTMILMSLLLLIGVILYTNRRSSASVNHQRVSYLRHSAAKAQEGNGIK